MAKYSSHRKHNRIPRRVIFVFLLIVVLVIVGTFLARGVYNDDLKSVSNNQSTKIYTVQSGASIKQIADGLESSHLIKSSWAFQIYVHSHNFDATLQAGTYAIAPSYNIQKIVSTLTQGKVATKLVTILPGVRIDQVKADLINDGFSPSSVTNALNPAQYSDLPVLTFKPTNVNTLEGLLWPDSFQKQPNTDPSVIIRESLQEMSNHLTPRPYPYIDYSSGS
jgi:UPF0755 protein